jgi:hypothetical protein
MGAFSGLCRAEIERLEWTEVDFDAGVIEVKASKSKTASRRSSPGHNAAKFVRMAYALPGVYWERLSC